MGSLSVFDGSGHQPDIDSSAFLRRKTSLDLSLWPLQTPAQGFFLDISLAGHD